MIFETLIDAGRLHADLGAGDWCLFDVRHQLTDAAYGESAYAAGHIPGAFFLHCDRDLSGPKIPGSGRHPLPDPPILAEKLRSCGLNSTTQVVVYDDSQGMIAGRLWWMLRWLGHRSVALLDGGLQAWVRAGGQLSTASLPVSKAGDFRPGALSGAVDAAFVESHLQSAGLRLVDARSPDRFRGENETLDPVGGHIPGAINRFFRDNLDGEGCLKAAPVLREEWQALLDGAAPQSVVHQCGSGVSGCLNLLAMEHAGLPGSRLYPGSWSEWCADPSRPVAR